MDKYNVPLQLPLGMKCPGCGAELIKDDGPPRCPVHGTEFLEMCAEHPAGVPLCEERHDGQEGK